MMNEASKMIYADKTIADAIIGKLRETNPAFKYDMIKLPVGHQIVRINVLPAYMPPAIPSPVAKHHAVAFTPSWAHGEVAVITAQFERETAKWLYFANAVGPLGVKFFHKSHVVSIDIENGNVTIKVPTDIAIKKGLIAGSK
jgi:hypothetical protein